MKHLIIALALLLAPAGAHATATITADFAGRIDYLGVDHSLQLVDFGTGVIPGDTFTGSFSFGGNGPATFTVSFPLTTFVGTNVSLSVFSDFYIEWFTIRAQTPNGDWMGVGLARTGTTHPDPSVFMTDLDCAHWYHCGFQLKASSQLLALEEGWAEVDSLRANNATYNAIVNPRPEIFSFTRVSIVDSPVAIPEPATWLLMLAGLGVIYVLPRKSVCW